MLLVYVKSQQVETHYPESCRVNQNAKDRVFVKILEPISKVAFEHIAEKDHDQDALG